jgi:predicted HNH restriction endonuclease
MAQPELEQLYRALMHTRFAFVPRGEHSLRAVYSAVQSQYPRLCDDTFLCSTNCRSGHNRPEWQHVVRKALQDLKKRMSNAVVRAQRGSWHFIASTAATVPLPEEIIDPAPLHEGAIRQILVNAYERNPEARSRCLAYYGVSCFVCSFNFADTYGEIGRDFIHVHHLRPLADIGEAYEVDPVADLRPVCPNCHAIIHRRIPALTIEEVQVLLHRAYRKTD